MRFNAEAILARSSNLPIQEIGNETMLLEVTSGKFFKLNEPAALAWKSLDGKRSLGAIATRITAVYDVDFDTALSDCLELAARLKKLGLAKVIPAAPVSKRPSRAAEASLR